jgi:uncharacterized CHY-type Zn-finger protein
MNPQKPNLDKSSEPKTYEKPKLYVEPPPQPCQHIRILDCDKPITRMFYECYHCHQGLLSECNGLPPVQDLDVRCPTCGKIAIRLVAQEVISTTPIPSPWEKLP